jgi:hypothetical protein
MMTERELLIKLILQSEILASEVGFFNCHFSKPKAECVADFLLGNGVNLPPVHVGSTVYYIVGATHKSPENCRVSTPREVVEISYKRQRGSERRTMSGFITEDGVRYGFNGIGKTVFLTREEAEAELKKRRKEVKNE